MATPKIDMTGARFGRLLVVNCENGVWRCRCDCGSFTYVAGHHLRSGRQVSCGCRNKEARQAFKLANTSHGQSSSPEYVAWGNMIRRCTKHQHPNFADYGGRGITVCQEWIGPGGFERFFKVIGPRPSAAHSLDRIDNDRGYEPGNVRWATLRQQMLNTRRGRVITHRGESLHLVEWAERLGVTPQTLIARLDGPYSLDEVLSAGPGRLRPTMLSAPDPRNPESVLEATASEWESLTGIPSSTIQRRLRTGWSVCDAVSKPSGPNGKRRLQ